MSIQTSLCPPTPFLSPSLCVLPSFPPFQHCFFFIISLLCFVCLCFSHPGTLTMSSQLWKKATIWSVWPFYLHPQLCNHACRVRVPLHTHTHNGAINIAPFPVARQTVSETRVRAGKQQSNNEPHGRRNPRDLRSLFTLIWLQETFLVFSVLQLHSANSSSMFPCFWFNVSMFPRPCMYLIAVVCTQILGGNLKVAEMFVRFPQGWVNK